MKRLLVTDCVNVKWLSQTQWLQVPAKQEAEDIEILLCLNVTAHKRGLIPRPSGYLDLPWSFPFRKSASMPSVTVDGIANNSLMSFSLDRRNITNTNPGPNENNSK